MPRELSPAAEQYAKLNDEITAWVPNPWQREWMRQSLLRYREVLLDEHVAWLEAQQKFGFVGWEGHARAASRALRTEFA